MTTQFAQPLTSSGRQRLSRERAQLLARRADLSARLRDELQDKGDDLNFYVTSEELAQLDLRLGQLEIALNAPSLPFTTSKGVVGVGSRATVRDEAGRQQTFTIVRSVEADPTHGCISDVSPVGSALLGKTPGNEVVVAAPGGDRRLTLVRVESPRG